MSNRLFQSIVYQMHDAIDRTIGVIDETGIVIACSDLVHIGEIHNSMAMNFSNTGDIITKGAYTYKPFGSNSSNEYVLFVDGIDPQAEKYAAVLAVSLTNIKQFYDEKYDRSNFIKNLILDNILQGDVYLKARELHFNNDINRAVLLIRVANRNDVSVYDVLQNLFPDKNKDFVININETDIALVKEIKTSVEAADLEKLARSIVDTLSTEFYVHVIVGIGKFGAYVRYGNNFASLAKGDDPYTLTFERALELIEAQKKSATAAATPIKTFEEDADLVIKNGRYGAYIAYKGKNYRIPRGKKVEALTYAECVTIVNSTKK